MSIREALVRDLEMMKIQLNATKLNYSINIYPYLKALTTEQYVDIILQVSTLQYVPLPSLK